MNTETIGQNTPRRELAGNALQLLSGTFGALSSSETGDLTGDARSGGSSELLGAATPQYK